MLSEKSLYIAIVFFVIFCWFGFLAYSFLLQQPNTSNLGITIDSYSYIYPIYNFKIDGFLRKIIGLLFAFITFCSGFGSIFFISSYIEYKKRS